MIARDKSRSDGRTVQIILGFLCVVVLTMGVALVLTVDRNTNTIGKEKVTIDNQNATAARTECVRQLSNDLSDKRWNQLANAFDGLRSKNTKEINASVDNLKELGGLLTDQITKACPASVGTGTTKKGT